MGQQKTLADLSVEVGRRYLEEACQALEANPEKTTGCMRSEAGGRCCLCVMYDTMLAIAARDKIILPETDYSIVEGHTALPPEYMGQFFGFSAEDNATYGTLELDADVDDSAAPWVKEYFSFNLEGELAEKHNDGRNYGENPVVAKSHAEIAALIRAEYLNRPTTPCQTEQKETTI